MMPIVLKEERAWRTYLGGRELDRFLKKESPQDSHFPELWMFSETQARNAGREDIVEGLSRTIDNPDITLKKLIGDAPEKMLGAKHVAQWGATMGVLFKIIDSQERLTVQVHPNVEKAKKLFHSQFGKTECWHILETRSDLDESAHIYLGFKEGITREEWIEAFNRQDVDKMLQMLHKIPVKKGDTFLVKGGVPHAIGAGCMLLEIQEPTDYTIRVEKTTPSGFAIDDFMCHQGLGFEKMFECFEYQGMTFDQLISKYRILPKKDVSYPNCVHIVDYSDTSCFRLGKMCVKTEVSLQKSDVFRCLFVQSGKGELRGKTYRRKIKAGDQLFIPAECEEMLSLSKADGDDLIVLIGEGPLSN